MNKIKQFFILLVVVIMSLTTGWVFSSQNQKQGISTIQTITPAIAFNNMAIVVSNAMKKLPYTGDQRKILADSFEVLKAAVDVYMTEHQVTKGTK